MDLIPLLIHLAQTLLSKHMGTIHYFLNMDSHHRLKGLFFTQQRLLKINMLQTKPISSPMSSAHKLSGSNEPEGIQMQNLSLTRLDISFVVRFI